MKVKVSCCFHLNLLHFYGIFKSFNKYMSHARPLNVSQSHSIITMEAQSSTNISTALIIRKQLSKSSSRSADLSLYTIRETNGGGE